MLTLRIPVAEFEKFLVIFLRVGAILFSAPVIGTSSVPVRAKAGLALFTTLVLMPVVFVDLGNLPAQPLALVPRLAGEVLVGAALGLAARFIFAGVEMAGEIISYQMGFSMVNVFDPQENDEVPIISQVQELIITLVFLTTGAYLVYLRAIAASFAAVPSLGAVLSGGMVEALVRMSSAVFVIGVKVGAPILAALMFSNVVLALVARMVPQMNVLIVGFPLNIAVGLVFLGASLPLFTSILDRLFGQLGPDLINLLHLMA